MYIRRRKNESGTETIYLVQSVRQEGKKHSVSKVIKCFGSSSDIEQLEIWLKEAEMLKAQLSKKKVTIHNITSIRQSEDILSCKVHNIGIKDFYDQLGQDIFLNFIT
jgi:hypothetical protein